MEFLDAIFGPAGWPRYEEYNSSTKDLISGVKTFLEVAFIGGVVGCLMSVVAYLPVSNSHSGRRSLLQGLVVLLTIFILPFAISHATGDYENGFMSLLVALFFLTVLTATLAHKPMRYRHIFKSEDAVFRPNFPSVLGVVILAVLGGLLGHVTGTSHSDIFGQLAPAIFAVAVTVAGFFVSSLSSDALEAVRNKALEGYDLRALTAQSLGFVLCFFLLFQIGERWSLPQQGIDACKSVYAKS